MKNLLDIVKQLNYFCFLLLVAAIPLPRHFAHYMLVIYFVTWLLEGRWLSRANIQWSKQLWPMIGLALWVVWESVSLLWGQHMVAGGNFRDAHISLLILPLVALFGLNEYYDYKQIARVYILSCLLSIPLYAFTLYWVANAGYVWSSGDAPLYTLTLKTFTDTLSPIKHRLYYGTDLMTALLLIGTLRHDICQRWGKVRGILAIVAASMLIIFTIFASGSRAVLLALLPITFVAIIRHTSARQRRWVVPTISAAAVVLLAGMMLFHPRMKELSLKWVEQPENYYNTSHFEPRIMIWHLAIEHPEDYCLYGMGVGNATPYLVSKYQQWEGLAHYAQSYFAAHNQYLEIAMELGLLAMLAFIAIWIALPLCQDRRSPASGFALYLSLLLASNMLTDCQLSRIEGIVFICTMLLVMRAMDRTLSEPSAEERA